ncbi:GPI-inositol-deacylase [Coprinopsis marcescibilis]|uniref:GPI inositol-deacylase n=1 Tax=Coprinopsis marcescibilis TaxID=230819 RepID=A0A5C3KZS3_COPMA|nr:GPI-inositol-deacylase [Coprinopsis marcescibilis]
MTDLEKLQRQSRAPSLCGGRTQMSRFFKYFLALGSLAAIVGLYCATIDIGETISPQGCRMSWMSPSYVLQSDFDSTWSPLAKRYSLWLYREVGWNAAQIGDSLPVLFLPGNAGSSHQVRSIASSAIRQYLSNPNHVSSEFASTSDFHRPLDVYTVDFNEDLSAFHGTTLQSQIEYTTQAISYILSLYPDNTRIILMGHSMGGIVATSQLPSQNISAIITMATPYNLPPARFDANIDAIFAKLQDTLAADPTPVVSLCGGAADKMIPSEACILPETPVGFRRTVFTSALEGSWTGVGHEAMVWCHQVRWRVARALLELAPQRARLEVEKTLDRWIRDGHTLPPDASDPQPLTQHDLDSLKDLRLGSKLVLKNPVQASAGSYRLLIPRKVSLNSKTSLTIMLSRGSINAIGPQHPIPLRASVFACDKDQTNCARLQPSALKLIPSPIPGKSFPLPREGSDESEGVVLFEADLTSLSDTGGSVIIKVDNATGEGWVLASVENNHPTPDESAGMMSLLLRGVTVPVQTMSSLKNVYNLPHILASSLLVYRATAVGKSEPRCLNVLFPPLLVHHSNPTETHYFTLRNQDEPRALLHTHKPGPFIHDSTFVPRGLAFTIYSSGLSECEQPLEGIRLTLDWVATLARWSTRYWTSVLAWAVGVVALNMFYSLDSHGHIEPVSTALERFTTGLLPRLVLSSFFFSFVPLPASLFLGNDGHGWFSVVAPLIMVISTGLVILMWWILSVVVYLLPKVFCIGKQRKIDTTMVSNNTLASMGVLLLAILLFIPWQVAFLGCWVYHFHTCAVHGQPMESENPPRRSNDNYSMNGDAREKPDKTEISKIERQNNQNLNMHILLLMTWLLPLVAPTLAVWVRTLITAGFTTAFDGDHNFLNVAPFLILVDFASWTQTRLFDASPFEEWIPARWLFAAVGGIAFIFGSRTPYAMFRATTVVLGIFVCTKIGRRYWKGTGR